MERPSFEDWYRGTHPRVVGVVAALTGRRDVAIDATDEAFVRAWARWERVSKMEAPEAWTVKVALNLVRRALRHAAQDATPVSVPEPAPATDPELWELVRSLSGQQRTAVVLRHIGGFSYAEIAQAMGVREGTVGSTLHAGHERLRELLVTDEEARVDG